MLAEDVREFLQKARVAIMITLRRDGRPHAVRIGLALVDGKIWSSGTQDRLRTRHVRRDPRSTLVCIDPSAPIYLTIESDVRILEGPDVPEQSLRLFYAMQRREPGTNLVWRGREVTPDEFRRTMVDERRLIYEFDPVRTYGLDAARRV